MKTTYGTGWFLSTVLFTHLLVAPIRATECPSITLNPDALPDAPVGVDYNQAFSASGGSPPYTFTITGGSFPKWFGLRSNGEIYGGGNALNLGRWTFVVTATDSNGCMGSRNYSISVPCPTPTGAGTQQIQIFSPLNNSIVATDSIRIWGTATDAAGNLGGEWILGGLAVWYSVNGGAARKAEPKYDAPWSSIGNGEQEDFSSWAANVILQPGTNTVVIYGRNECGDQGCIVTNNYFWQCSPHTNAEGCPPIGFRPGFLPDPEPGVPYTQIFSAGAWFNTGSMNATRYYHTATPLSDGKVLITGGWGEMTMGGMDDLTASAEVYDPTSGTWTLTQPMNRALIMHKATLLPNGQVLVTGGYENRKGPVADAQLYDPISGTWTNTGPMAVARYSHAAALLPNGKVIVAGGSDGVKATSSVEIYDPATGKWTACGAMPAAVGKCRAVVLTTGVLVAAAEMEQASPQFYDAILDTWTLHSSSNTPPFVMSAVALKDGTGLLAGHNGFVWRFTNCCVKFGDWFPDYNHDSILRMFDPISKTYPYSAPIAVKLLPEEMTLLASGKVLGIVNGTGQLYDPTSRTWSDAGQMRYLHNSPTITLLPNGKVLVVASSGQYNRRFGREYLNECELYDPAAGGTPPYRYGITSGLLPDGFSLSTNGVLSGTSASFGSWNFAVTATDANGCTGSQNYSLTIPRPIICINSSECSPIFFPAKPGVPYVFRNVAGGGTAPYNFSLTGGNLPPGVTLSREGVLSGTPGVIGDYRFTMTATDARGSTGARTYRMSISADLFYSELQSVKITSPKNGSIIPSGGEELYPNIITVKGRFTDWNGIPGGDACVWYSFNGGPFLYAQSDNSRGIWYFDVSLNYGSNTVVVYSGDRCGDPGPSVTNNYFYGRYAPVTISVNGDGIVSIPNGAQLLIGRSYTITATAKPGNLFSNWVEGSVLWTAGPAVGSSTDQIIETNRYTFMMRSDLILTANIISNPAVAGAYYGLFSETNACHESSGFMRLALGGNNAFSGSMTIGGDTYPFSGKLWRAGRACVTIPRYKQGKEPLSVSLDFLGTRDQVSGEICNSALNASIVLNRAVYGPGNPPPNAGKYTFLLPHNDDPASSPGGDSYATVSISTNGTLSAVGAMGDGAAFSQSVPISRNGQWPFFGASYPKKYSAANPTNPAVSYVNSGYSGSALGWITFSSNTPTGTVTWINKGSNTSIYTHGFTNQLPLLGSAYVPPSGGVRMVAMTNGNSIVGNANLNSPLTNDITLLDNNLVAISNNFNRLSIKLLPASGLMNGAFSNSATKKMTSFKGAMLQSQSLGGGWSVGTNQSGFITIQPGR